MDERTRIEILTSTNIWKGGCQIEIIFYIAQQHFFLVWIDLIGHKRNWMNLSFIAFSIENFIHPRETFSDISLITWSSSSSSSSRWLIHKNKLIRCCSAAYRFNDSFIQISLHNPIQSHSVIVNFWWWCEERRWQFLIIQQINDDLTKQSAHNTQKIYKTWIRKMKRS